MSADVIVAINNFCEAFASLVTGIGILAAGLWAFFQFSLSRLRFPRASIEHEIIVKPLTSKKRLLHVIATVSNTGHVLIPITSVWTKLYLISPVAEQIRTALEAGEPVNYEGAEVDWPEFDCRQITHEKDKAEIEPGESERFEFEFIFDVDLKIVSAYTFFKNSVKNGPGWCRTTIIDFAKTD
jgi:hypothetical protein